MRETARWMEGEKQYVTRFGETKKYVYKYDAGFQQMSSGALAWRRASAGAFRMCRTEGTLCVRFPVLPAGRWPTHPHTHPTRMRHPLKLPGCDVRAQRTGWGNGSSVWELCIYVRIFFFYFFFLFFFCTLSRSLVLPALSLTVSAPSVPVAPSRYLAPAENGYNVVARAADTHGRQDRRRTTDSTLGPPRRRPIKSVGVTWQHC